MALSVTYWEANLNKIVLDTTAGTYTVEPATLLEVLNPATTLDAQTSVVRTLGFALLGFLLG